MAVGSIIQRRFSYLGGGRFASESPADLVRNRWTGLDRNGWPFCLGIRNHPLKIQKSLKEAKDPYP